MKSPIKKFKINRKNWLRGGKARSCLLNRDGYMCCLGFYSLARGINRQYILEKACPSELINKNHDFMLPEFVNLKVENDNELSTRLMSINDSISTSDIHKEKLIKKNFKKLGVKVEFFG